MDLVRCVSLDHCLRMINLKRLKMMVFGIIIKYAPRIYGWIREIPNPLVCKIETKRSVSILDLCKRFKLV